MQEESTTAAPHAPQALEVGKFLAWGALAGFGGAVKYVAAILRSEQKVSNRRFLALLSANMFISSFCGLMGAMLVSTFTNEMMWHGLAAGMFGYTGTAGLDWVMIALKKKIDPTATAEDVIAIPPSVDE